MNECRKGVYANNKIIRSMLFTCFGGGGSNKPCEYLKECVEENNLKLVRRGKKNRLVV